MLWECSKGHRWEATGNNIKLKNTWCPICSGSQRLSIDIMQEVARQRKKSYVTSSQTHRVYHRPIVPNSVPGGAVLGWWLSAV